MTTKWGIQDINWFCLLKLSRNKLKSVEEMNEYFFSFCLITRVDGEKMWLTHPNNVIIEDTSMLVGDIIFCSQLQKISFKFLFYKNQHVAIADEDIIFFQRHSALTSLIYYWYKNKLQLKNIHLFILTIISSTTLSGSKNPLEFEILI